MCGMRDIFEEMETGSPLDPIEAARRAVRPSLRRRFYKLATVGPEGEAFRVLLDGRPIRTPGRRVLAAPSHRLAEEIAAEWEAQTEVVDPAKMLLTRLANTVIDGVADNPSEVAAEVGNYLGSDLLFYRADGPEGLVARQAEHWDPLLEWARDE